MIKRIQEILKKVPILRYIISGLIKWFLIFTFTCAVLFGVLHFTGKYSTIESVLDLKYNSPFITFPITLFTILSILSFVIGCLMYFHKYKRTKIDNKFSKEFFIVLNETDDSEISHKRK